MDVAFAAKLSLNQVGFQRVELQDELLHGRCKILSVCFPFFCVLGEALWLLRHMEDEQASRPSATAWQSGTTYMSCRNFQSVGMKLKAQHAENVGVFQEREGRWVGGYRVQGSGFINPKP